MGCNCNKDKLEMRKSIRNEIKKKIADVKKLWHESANVEGAVTVTTNKNQLGFK